MKITANCYHLLYVISFGMVKSDLMNRFYCNWFSTLAISRFCSDMDHFDLCYVKKLQSFCPRSEIIIFISKIIFFLRSRRSRIGVCRNLHRLKCHRSSRPSTRRMTRTRRAGPTFRSRAAIPDTELSFPDFIVADTQRPIKQVKLIK